MAQKEDSDAVDSTVSSKITLPAEAIIHADQPWELVGVDVFVQSDSLPKIPQSIGKFTLSMISNRGTKVYPGILPDIHLDDCFRIRWTSSESITNADVMDLLKEFPEEYPWMHIEKLHKQGDTLLYSKAQGE